MSNSDDQVTLDEGGSDDLDSPVSPADAFTARLRHKRWEQGLSRAQLAQLAGVTRAYVSMIESGKRRPSPSQLALFARVLEVDESELLRSVTARQFLDWGLQEIRSPGQPLSEAARASIIIDRSGAETRRDRLERGLEEAVERLTEESLSKLLDVARDLAVVQGEGS